MKKLILFCKLTMFLLVNGLMHAHQIAIVGCGYVGLTLASVLLHQGHTIVCIDVDAQKISELQHKHISIFEPQLQTMLCDAFHDKKISFTQNIDDAQGSTIYYICVATPTDASGKSDCAHLYEAFDTTIKNCTTTDAIICIKSTVPPGTMRTLAKRVPLDKQHSIHVIYNPEFMREGSAISDIYTNPLVLGGDSLHGMQEIEKFYTAFLHPHVKIIKTNFETAELIKYAWNSFSAIRIAFVNELAYISKLFDADIETVTQGMALSEQLLPTHLIKPGPGYGGSCLPKDTASFAHVMQKNGFLSSLVHQAIQSNQEHKKRVIDDIFNVLDPMDKQHTVALLGLSFKANTNDIRNAPSIDIIQALLERNITVRVYDPQAMDDMKKLFPSLHYSSSTYEAIQQSDCLVILTEWQEFKELDFNKVASLCRKKVIIDTRNMYDADQLSAYGFTCVT